MKFINRISMVILTVAILSCNSTELDLLDSPNSVSPEKAGIDFIYNRIQLDFEDFYTATLFDVGEVSRMMVVVTGFTYNDVWSPTSFNGQWNDAYANIFPDVDALLTIADERGLDIHAGSAMIMKAYVMITLVDLFNNVPYSEALQGTDVISPNQDPGQAVYTAAENLLDDAIARLSGTVAAEPAVDIFYDGDADNWIKLANTLKMKIYLQTRLVDSNAGSKFQAIVQGGNFIDDPSEDFEFQYGTNRTNPNARHPLYNDAYETNDAVYQSNYYMWLLNGEKEDINGDDIQDPRLNFYFMRQVGTVDASNVNIFSCVLSDLPAILDENTEKPAHFTAVDPEMPYCILSTDGYYGRDHLNGSGIPPDGGIRTVWGIYPAGGAFDDGNPFFVQNSGTDGGLGAGIAPIMHSSFVYFMRAEMALMAGTGEDPKTMMLTGVEHSMEKVFNFSTPLIDGAKVVDTDINGNDVTLQQAFLDPYPGLQADYISKLGAVYDAAGDKLDVIMKEYMIALYGNPLELYNSIRRTSRPLNLAPKLDNTVSEQFTWSALYPADHVDLNANATQKSVTDKVFWDTTPGDAVR